MTAGFHNLGFQLLHPLGNLVQVHSAEPEIENLLVPVGSWIEQLLLLVVVQQQMAAGHRNLQEQLPVQLFLRKDQQIVLKMVGFSFYGFSKNYFLLRMGDGFLKTVNC